LHLQKVINFSKNESFTRFSVLFFLIVWLGFLLLDFPFFNLLGSLWIKLFDFIHDSVHDLLIGVEVSSNSPVGKKLERV